MASEARRLAQLPGYDTAPDVYETPDDSTAPSTSRADTDDLPSSPDDEEPTSSSPTDSDSDAAAISHRRLYPSRARSRFGTQARSIDPHPADWSDRVDGRRSGFRARRHGPSSPERDETLEARIARLRREIEECKVAALQEGPPAGEHDDDDDPHDLDAMAQLLASLDASGLTRARAKPSITANNKPPAHPLPAPLPSDEILLARLGAFDTRLTALESTLGISALSANPQAHTTPVLPSLTLLDAQLAALSSATSLTALDAASTRIAALKAETHSLATHALATQQQSQSHPSKSTSTSPPTQNPDLSDSDADPDAHPLDPSIALLAPTDGPRLHALYTLLPTLQALAPTVPPLLTRLQSLRSLHAAAASAAKDVEQVEELQGVLDGQLRVWKEGLEKVEQAVEDADKANGRNGMMVKEWVDDVVGRVKALR